MLAALWAVQDALSLPAVIGLGAAWHLFLGWELAHR